MPTLIDGLALSANPFQNYTAETEPHLSHYAIKPPYLEAVLVRARQSSSFILFGKRGSGKSATRLTMHKSLWGQTSGETAPLVRTPLLVEYTDFTRFTSIADVESVNQNFLISEAAFLTLEAFVCWLGSLGKVPRINLLENIPVSGLRLAMSLLKVFYFKRDREQRKYSDQEVFSLLNQPLHTNSLHSVRKRWKGISGIVSVVTQAFARKYVDADLSIARSMEDVLNTFASDSGSGTKFVLIKLTEMARAFGFSGVVVLVDKVDETVLTEHSAYAAARLMHPLLSHTHLLEIDGFAWQFFLWDETKRYFSRDELAIRLDRIPNCSVRWDLESFRFMLDRRMAHFSDDKLRFEDLLISDSDVDGIIEHLVALASNSPRELVKLVDTIIREHDMLHAERLDLVLIGEDSLRRGQDVYAREGIS